MKHTDVVRGVETRANLACELNRFINRKTADATQKRRELLTLDVFHREEVATISFADVVNPADILVTHLSCHAHFTMKPGEGSAIGQEMVRQKLQRDGLAQLQIVGSIYLAHSAFAQ